MLFDTRLFKSMHMRNRIVRSATWEGMAGEHGTCTPELVEMMRDLAVGGVGLIISGHMYVSSEGQASLKQLGIHKDELVTGLSVMVKAVHEEGGAIAAQLAHGGCHGAFRISGLETIGPSVPDEVNGFSCREMTYEDIQKTVRSFGDAARRAENAGFDAVQIHSAHGYLLSQFLSPYYNKRNDIYGGDLANRARFLIEVVKTVKINTSDDFPVLVKINSDDYLEGGFSVDEMIRVSKMLQEAGVDAVEMSGGTVNEGSRYKFSRTLTRESEDDEVYYREAAKRYKEVCSVPLILVGGIRSYNVSEELLSTGTCDLIAMSRPFIREPHLITRWGSGDTRPARCISCNACFRPARQGKGLYCVVEDCLRKKG